ncbi:hypothetical protein L1887_14209 [Cichorium endivia]|nr:hypothetical protein L1887_14209 [Cichorium endivia]
MLCNDIKTGILSTQITVPSIRTAMAMILKPIPELDDKIHEKCLYELIKQLFPNVKYIYGIMEPYLKKLRHNVGGIPLLSEDYGSSESNMTPTPPA